MVRMPAIFIGHGSPYNLFDTNDFTLAVRKFGKNLFEKYHPDAIVIISAHWLTKGTHITHPNEPKLIYDYYNFPQKFYEYTYPVKGSSITSRKIYKFLPNILRLSDDWGIDHAATIVLENILPSGNIPVIEMSLDYPQTPQFHFDLGKKISKLREENILFIGSGNLIHTFREMDFNLHAEPMEWAKELDLIQKEVLDTNNSDMLINYNQIPLSNRGFQTLDHYLPMLYIMGMKQEEEKLTYIFEGIQHGSVSHRSFIVE